MVAPLKELRSPPPDPTVRRHRTLKLLVVETVVAVAIIVAAISMNHSPSFNASVPGRQLASMRQACQHPSGSTTESVRVASGNVSCAAMTDWMTQQLRSGHMTGTVMWGNSTRMSATCRRWMATGPGATASDAATHAWCDGFVVSMTQHVDNWDNWMMNGHMMGR